MVFYAQKVKIPIFKNSNNFKVFFKLSNSFKDFLRLFYNFLKLHIFSSNS
jgi:hypothetical protein